MKQEDKQLLLQDLCSRLPYKVNIQVKDWTTLETELELGHIRRLQNEDLELKPFLRPMSSMTEEEEKEFNKVVYDSIDVDNISPCVCIANWLYSKYFDVNGLIPKGLALEAPEGMYEK